MEGKRYVSVNQLVECLALEDGVKILNIYFDKYVKDNYNDRHVFIVPIAFTTVDEDKTTTTIPLNDIYTCLPSMQFISVSGKAATDIKNKAVQKKLNRLCVILDKISFKARDGREVYYFNSVIRDANQEQYRKMKDALESARAQQEEEKNKDLLAQYDDYFIEE